MRPDRGKSSSIWFRIGAKNISKILLGSNQVCRQRVENKQRHAINIASHSEGNLAFDFFASWQPVIAADDLRAEFSPLRFVPLVLSTITGTTIATIATSSSSFSSSFSCSSLSSLPSPFLLFRLLIFSTRRRRWPRRLHHFSKPYASIWS